MKRSALTFAALPTAAVLVMSLSACGGQQGSGGSGDKLSGTVTVDGSSTVLPLSEATAEAFRKVQPGVNVTVAKSGTGGGFKKFCAGEIDISDASRRIKDEEKKACAAKGIEFVELTVANDGLSVIVNKENDFAKCLTLAHLKKMWAPASKGVVMNWNQVDPAFPNLPLSLAGAGTDSGTFEYFSEAVNGKAKEIRPDYAPSEDDNVIVTAIAGNKGSAGFLGYSYVEANKEKIKHVAVDGGAGCVEPSVKTVQDGTYKPLSRPLFIYVSKKSYKDKPEVKAFVDFYGKHEEGIIKDALLIPLNDKQKAASAAELAKLS